MSDSVESNTRDADRERVQKHVNELLDHFDSVQIFTTRHMPAELDGTITCNRGGGNWHSRYGQVREWVVYEEERIRTHARKSEEET